MKVQLNTYPAGIGDCVTLSLSNEQEVYNVLIDCGKKTSKIEDVVCKQWGKHINLLVVTHIDSDHITGIKNLLKKHGDITIDQIWFNCYQRNEPDDAAKLTDDQKAKLETFTTHLFEKELIGQINEPGAVLLADVLLANQQWRDVWEKQYIVKGKELPIAEGRLGILRVIAPSQDNIDILDKKFVKLFRNCFFEKKLKNYPNDSSIYELLIRLADEEESLASDNAKPVGVVEITAESLEKSIDEKVSDITDSNKASIAMVWELNEHSILLLGDSDPVIVSEYLKNKDHGEKHVFDAIKVSHHGSNHNTTKDIVEYSDSKHYFFTGGCDDERPGLAAVSRIICRELPEGIDERVLHYNKKTNVIQALEKNVDVKSKYKYIMSSDNAYEIEI